MLNLEIEGMDRLEAELNALGSSIAETLEDAVLAGGMIIADQAVQNAPYLSGTLRSAIVAGSKESVKPASAGDISVSRKGKFSVEGTVGPRGVPYARIQEYGGVTGRGHKTRIQGKFYMTRAVEMRQKQAEDEMVRVITMGVNQ